MLPHPDGRFGRLGDFANGVRSFVKTIRLGGDVSPDPRESIRKCGVLALAGAIGVKLGG